MEEVAHKVSWDLRWEVHYRVAKRLPPRASWRRLSAEAANEMGEITIPIDAQLEEDTEWKE